MRGDGGVAGEGTVVGVPKFHSRGKSDWLSNASSGLCIIYIILYYLYYLYYLYIEQSNRTPTAAGLPWLEHFRVQCYT